MAVHKVIFKCDGCGELLSLDLEQVNIVLDGQNQKAFIHPKEWLSKVSGTRMYQACSRSCAIIISMKENVDDEVHFK